MALIQPANAGRGGKKRKKAQKSPGSIQKGLTKSEKRSNTGTGEPIEVQPSENGPLRGMRKWLSEYHRQRPGFEVLQQRTDEFIADFEEREEKGREEREAAALEEGWTVVEHHKGRKKTTDVESGISVGGVALAAVERKQKKQYKDESLNFYRFQRREARRNEILELQQRFEEDKKKIMALRLARKFRPY